MCLYTMSALTHSLCMVPFTKSAMTSWLVDWLHMSWTVKCTWCFVRNTIQQTVPFHSFCLVMKCKKINNSSFLLCLFPPPPSSHRWGAFTIAGMPSQLNRGSRGATRSLRQARNGGGLLKTMPLPTSARNSSTLPRVSPRYTGPVSVCILIHNIM